MIRYLAEGGIFEPGPGLAISPIPVPIPANGRDSTILILLLNNHHSLSSVSSHFLRSSSFAYKLSHERRALSEYRGDFSVIVIIDRNITL